MYCLRHIPITYIKKARKMSNDKVTMAINRWASHNRWHVTVGFTRQYGLHTRVITIAVYCNTPDDFFVLKDLNCQSTL